MNSTIRKVLAALVLLAVVALVALFFSLNSMVKQGVVAFGPEVIKAPIQLDGVSISAFSGKGELTGLVVGNPEGFKTPNAVKLATASLQVNPASLMADKIVVHSIKVDAAEITFEGSLGSSNLGKIQENVDAYVASLLGPAGKEGKTDKKSAGKKLQVDELVISNAKINLSMTILGGKSATIPLPEIKLTNLGQGADGITPAEVIKVVMKEVMSKATTAIVGALGSLDKGVTNAVKGTAEAAKGVTKSLGDLFKKKE